jgi:hypothetical protein
MDVSPEPEIPKLKINETLEIFLETKEISVKTRCTYEELYITLKREWNFIEELTDVVFPFEYYKDEKTFIMNDYWNFEGGNFSMLSEGSFVRISTDGRNI